MIGRLLSTIVNILFITYMVLLISFFFLHESLKNNINEINYSILDSISTTGVFSDDTYNYLKKQVFQYSGGSSYQVVVKYEKKVKPGVYDTYWKKDWIAPDDLNNMTLDPATGLLIPKNDEILTRVGRPEPMHLGDKVSIYLEDQNQTLFVKLLNAPFLGMLNEYTDMRIKSLKTVVVGKNAKSVVKGYELVSELQTKAGMGNPWTNKSGSPVIVNVKTETNPTGQLYARNGSTVNVAGSNIAFSLPATSVTIAGQSYTWKSAYDETIADMKYNPVPVPPATNGELGPNHIFSTAEFYRQVTEYYTVPLGSQVSDYEKVIEFTQK